MSDFPAVINPGDAGHIAAHELLATLFETVLVQGVLSSRPAAGVARRTFYATDTKQWFRDDGSTWHEIVTAESIESLLKLLVELPASPKAFGAIGDGASHQLSSRFATLSAAQAVYPHATALTDEIDWAAWQAALNTGRDVAAYDGTYRLAAAPTSGAGYGQLAPKSNQRVYLGASVTMKPLPTFRGGVFRIDTKTNVVIEGPGTLDGDKTNNIHMGTFGVLVYSSSRVRLRGFSAINFPGSDDTGGGGGDGLYIGRNPSGAASYDVEIDGVTATGNVRQAISIISCKKLRIRNCDLSGTTGSNPGAGIDFEPDDTVNDLIDDVIVENNKIDGNYTGIVVSVVQATTRITIKHNVISNSRGASIGHGVYIFSAVGRVRVLNNDFIDNQCAGVHNKSTTGTKIKDNYFTNPNVTPTSTAFGFIFSTSATTKYEFAGNHFIFTSVLPSGWTAIYIQGSAATGNTTGHIHDNRCDLGALNCLFLRSDNCADVTIANNEIWNGGAANSYGMYIWTDSSRGIGHLITGNRITGCVNGFAFAAGTAHNRATGNLTTGNTNPTVNLGAVSNEITASGAL